MSSGTADIGSTRPLRAEQPAHPVESVDGLAEQLPQRDDQQVADRVVVQLTVAAEAVLQDIGPRPAPLVVAAQCGQRHPQIARRQYAELRRRRPDEPPLSATVTTAVSWSVT